MSRDIERIYRDPIDVIWIETARRCGMEVVRDPEVFASWDGNQQLKIGDSSSLDPDDSLAQMILHELCHGLIEGAAGQRLPDWGLDFDDPLHRSREFACLRLQARLADTVGLREFFAATTDFREYYDNLPDELGLDSTAETEDRVACEDEIAELAAEGWERFQTSRWAAPIQQALQATRKIADAIQPFAGPLDLWSCQSALLTPLRQNSIDE